VNIADIVGALAILIAIGTVIANLILGAQYDLDNRKHPAAKMPKQTSNPNRTTKCQ
jgi:hypothetical protein